LSGNLSGFLNPIKLVTYFCQPGLGLSLQTNRVIVKSAMALFH